VSYDILSIPSRRLKQSQTEVAEAEEKKEERKKRKERGKKKENNVNFALSSCPTSFPLSRRVQMLVQPGLLTSLYWVTKKK